MASPFSDADLQDLPDDPQLAFVRFAAMMRAWVRERTSDLSEDDSGADLYLEYINKVVGAAKALEIEGLKDYAVPLRRNFEYPDYADFVASVDHYAVQIQLHTARRTRGYSVRLDEGTKQKVRHFVEQIKDLIDKCGLPDAKREALLNKLNAFLGELDRDRTRFDALAAAWIELCTAAGEGVEKLEPARRWIDSIANLLGKVKEAEEAVQGQLPPPADRPRLEPPRSAASRGYKGTFDLDDEIPF